MFERVSANLIAVVTACAAAILAVFALGFALYALVEPQLGPAGAAASVAGAAALLIGAIALGLHLRAKQKEREAAVLQAELADSMPLGIGGFAKDHPLVAIGVTVLGGALAARHPKLSRDLLAIVARFTGR